MSRAAPTTRRFDDDRRVILWRADGAFVAHFDRRPDGRWVRTVADAVVDDEGAVTLLDWSEAGVSPVEYAPDGEPIAVHEPDGYPGRLDRRGHWAITDGVAH